MLRLFSLLLAVAALSGCATNLYLPGNRMFTSESTGEALAGSIEVGRAGVTQIQVADNITSSSPDTTPELIENSSLSTGLQLGVARFADLYYHNSSGGPYFVGVKAQLLGSSQKEAKAESFSLSVAGGVAMGSLNTETTTNGVKGTSTVSYGGWEGVVLAGYRPSSKSLIYLGPFYSSVTADIEIQRTSSGVTTTTVSPNGEGVMQGASLGLRLGGATYLNLEVSQTQTEWTRKEPSEEKVGPFTDTAWGAWVGTSW